MSEQLIVSLEAVKGNTVSLHLKRLVKVIESVTKILLESSS